MKKNTLPKWRREIIAGSPNPFIERQQMEELRRAAKTVWDKRKI